MTLQVKTNTEKTYSENKFLDIKEAFKHEYQYAKKVKSKSQDPTEEPESKLSESIEEKVAVILDAPILIDVIRQWSHLDRNEMVLKVMDSIMDLPDMELEKKLNLALKTALGILTEGVVSAPRDGLLEVKIDEDNFLRLVLAGPIRAAGGSLMGLIICYAELLRQKHSIGPYLATRDEIDKTTAEVLTYQRTHPSQISPSAHEISHVIEKCPILIDGIETEIDSIPFNKITPRIPCGKVRGGACLAIVEGLIIRVKKIEAALKKLGLNWAWLEDLKNLGSKYRVGGQRKIKDTRFTLSIGRPLLSVNDNSKGLRMRIGKTPTNGLCGAVVSPELIDLLGFLNVGTQLVVSEPGKGCTITGVSDDLELPIVKYKDHSVGYYRLGTRADVHKILDLGEILCNLGDFVEFKTALRPRDYDRSLWRVHTENALSFTKNFCELLEHTKKYARAKIHPYYNLFLKDLNYSEFIHLRNKWNGKTFQYSKRTVEALDTLCCAYDVDSDLKTITPTCPENLSYHLLKDFEINAFEFYEEESNDVLKYVNKKLKQSNLPVIGEKGFFSITARIGRPQNISLSKMKPQNAYSLANYRPARYSEKFWKSVQKQPYGSSRCLIRYCSNCKKESAYRICSCKAKTEQVKYCLKCEVHYSYEDHTHDDHKSRHYFNLYRNYYEELSDLLNQSPVLYESLEKSKIKLQKGNTPYPESLVKGLLRAKYELPVTKDGTIGLNAGNASTTHFTPKSIGTDVATLIRLGYDEDINGSPLSHENQVLSMKLNDAIYPKTSIPILLSWTKFVDDVLEYYYKDARYYEITKEEQLRGILTIIIAPHISNGVVTRIIGFSENQSVYSHPLSVTTRRRDQDGDIDRTCLLMDCLLNCSRKFVSESKIGALMSIPLTLSLDLMVNQTGKEILYAELFRDYNLYPVLDNTQTYTADQLTGYPCYEDFLNKRLTEKDIFYNTPGLDISSGNLTNMYKDAKNNEQKIDLMLNVEDLLTFVDNRQSLEGVIEGHLYPDLRGNLNAYFKQAFRCSKCGKKQSIDLLSKNCNYCKNGEFKPTVYPNMVLKYVKILENLLLKQNLDDYFKAKIRVVLEEAQVLRSNNEEHNFSLFFKDL